MAGQEDRDIVKKRVTSLFNRMLNDVLSTVQVLTKNEYQYSVARAKLLRLGNNCLRELHKELDYADITLDKAKYHEPSSEYTLNKGQE